MRVLLVHNHYQQPGGEDRVFEEEGWLLEANGHHVTRYTAHNDEVQKKGRAALAAVTLWNQCAYRELRECIRQARPEVMHVHNTLPLISPAAYYAAQREGVAVVKTLHNYRLLCPEATFRRDGRVCEDCLGKRVPWPGVVHACYRDSRAATGAVTVMLAAHRAAGTWTRQIDVYIALTEFARRKFVEGGLASEQLRVKPHFVHPNPTPGQGKGGYALYVGRLSEEKGVRTLLSAWPRLAAPPLKIVGEGPLAPLVVDAASESVEWLGRQSPEAVSALMAEAAFVVVPSECYETFGRVIAEAFAVGTPVLAAGHGAPAELVTPGRTGQLFRPGDAEDLAAKAEQMWVRPERLTTMRGAARAEFEKKYTAARNYETLIGIYEDAIRRRVARM